MPADFFKVMPTWRYGDDGSVLCDSPLDPLETDVLPKPQWFLTLSLSSNSFTMHPASICNAPEAHKAVRAAEGLFGLWPSLCQRDWSEPCSCK